MADKAVSKLTQVVNHAVIGNCSIISQKGSGANSTNRSSISSLQVDYSKIANSYSGGSNAYGTRTVSSDRITPPVRTVHDIWYDVYPRTWTSAQSTVYVINQSTPTTLIKAPMIYVKQNNIWKQVTEAWIKDSGTWKQFLYSPLAFTARVLSIGGGGAGATGIGGRNCGNGIMYSIAGGGGGGGGFIDSSVQVFYSTTYNITVGGGGGGNSVFSTVIAYGGGNGGGGSSNGASGGCGGGGAGGWAVRTSVGYSAGAGSQGFSGGGGQGFNGRLEGNSGGGGGAGGAGAGTAGGAGRVSDITGSSITYSQGGDGAPLATTCNTSWANAGSKGSYGGGGNGGINWPQTYNASGCFVYNCRDNTGQGGGGGTQGIVIIRCASSINATTTGTVSITTAGTDKVYSFTSNGTIRFT